MRKNGHTLYWVGFLYFGFIGQYDSWLFNEFCVDLFPLTGHLDLASSFEVTLGSVYFSGGICGSCVAVGAACPMVYVLLLISNAASPHFSEKQLVIVAIDSSSIYNASVWNRFCCGI